MIGLRIEFSLASEVGEMSHPLHLDSLLAYAATQENGGDWRDITIPVSQERGVYKCSALHFERTHARLFSRIQKTEESIIVEGIGTYVSQKRVKNDFSLACQQFKNSIFSSSVFRSEKAIAYCVGDKDKIESLLRHIRTVGPLAKLGMGQVTGFTVTKDTAANERWQERVLPWCPDKTDYFPLQAATTFPYWKVENIQQAWVHKSVA